MLSLAPRRKKVPFQSVFRTSCCLRWVPISSTSDCTLFEATIRSRLLRPGYSLTTPYSGFVNRLQNSSFPPCLLSKLRGSDFFPGRLAFFLLNISALSGRTKVRRSQAFSRIQKSCAQRARRTRREHTRGVSASSFCDGAIPFCTGGSRGPCTSR